MGKNLETATMAGLYLEQGHTRKAIALLEKIIRDNDKDIKALTLLEEAVTQQNESKASIQEDIRDLSGDKRRAELDSTGETYANKIDKPVGEETKRRFGKAKALELLSEKLGRTIADAVSSRVKGKLSRITRIIKERRL